jgi:hypothetical protein
VIVDLREPRSAGLEESFLVGIQLVRGIAHADLDTKTWTGSNRTNALTSVNEPATRVPVLVL